MGGMRIFTNKIKREQLFKLLEEGYSYKSISRHFDCHHSSIIFWARKLGIPVLTPFTKRGQPVDAIPPGKFSPKSRVLIKPKRDWVDHPIDNYIQGDKINRGKSYKEYLEAERLRKTRTLEDIVNKKPHALT